MSKLRERPSSGVLHVLGIGKYLLNINYVTPSRTTFTLDAHVLTSPNVTATTVHVLLYESIYEHSICGLATINLSKS